MNSKINPTRVALFLDVENLIITSKEIGLIFDPKLIISRIREEGTLIFARAYADWTQHWITPYIPKLLECSIQMEMLSTSSKGKNTADLQLAVDAMEMGLSPGSPDVFVIGAHDRDYVPLAQKLRRYGKRVISCGFQDYTSTAYANAFSEVLFVDNLVISNTAIDPITPETLVAQGETPLEKPVEAIGQISAPTDIHYSYRLLERAINAVERNDPIARGSATYQMMRQIDPTFDYIYYGYASFKEYVLSAQKAGIINAKIPDGPGDIELYQPSKSTGLFNIEPYRYDTDEAAVESYRTLLYERKRVVLAPWKVRETLVRELWKRIENPESQGTTIQEMNDILKEISWDNAFYTEDYILKKMTGSLNLGKCFMEDNFPQQIMDLQYTRVLPACDVDSALNKMDGTYVKGIVHADPRAELHEKALAMLLFDCDEEWAIERARKARYYAELRNPY